MFHKHCVNLGCLTSISGINLSPGNKNLFTVSFSLYSSSVVIKGVRTLLFFSQKILKRKKQIQLLNKPNAF